MKTYAIPENHLFRLLEACSSENNCIQGDVDCECQKSISTTMRKRVLGSLAYTDDYLKPTDLNIGTKIDVST